MTDRSTLQGSGVTAGGGKENLQTGKAGTPSPKTYQALVHDLTQYKRREAVTTRLPLKSVTWLGEGR